MLGTHRARTVGGTAVELTFVHVGTLSEGKATRFTEYFDASPLVPELGAELGEA